MLRNKLKSLWKKYRLAVSIGITLFSICYNHFWFELSADPAPILPDLNKMQEQTMDMISRMNELLMSLATAIFGIVGFLIVEKFGSITKLSKNALYFSITALCCATISIDFGYIYMQTWVEQLSENIFQPFDGSLIIPRKLQFLSFIASLIFLGLFITTNLNESKN
ncbi:hypothetical protein ABN763_06340 [Spongiivirga sp. MCCC 1A20706]|uniref:hypothetical protein n=1 Tax=Spongiivirga sp. MCCC 1A20706 TaxID=3160963 RepID=UPI003977B5CA